MRPLFTSTPVAYIGETIITEDERRTLCELLVREATRLQTASHTEDLAPIDQVRILERAEGILWAFNAVCVNAARTRIEAKLPTEGSNDNGRNS